MKTFAGLYPHTVSLPNLYRAYHSASKGRKDSSFRKDLHGNLWKLHEELSSHSYEPSAYTVFYVDDCKRRRIMAPHFRDHAVHHAIYNFMEPVYDRLFIHDSYACRKGKGTHKGFLRLKHFVNSARPEDCFLKCDISRYFYSIDRYRLISIIRKRITDEELLALLWKIIGSHREESLPSHIVNPEHEAQRKGIPIDNLTSQVFADIYLNELDCFVKDSLKVKWYVRCVDDFIIIHKSKEYLHDIWRKMRGFLRARLFLTLDPRKTQMNKIAFGVDFLGYVGFGRYVRVRSRNCRRYKKI